MRRWVFENGLSLFFLGLFLLSLFGQSVAGLQDFNEQQAAHAADQISYWRYVVSSEFGGAVMENWQSEFLQFTMFILATIWLVQRGSNESKMLDEVGLESDQKQKVRGYAQSNSPAWAKVDNWRRRVYENSLLIAMTSIFFLTWLAQALSTWTTYNSEQLEHDNNPVSFAEYLTRPNFWERTLQNWQSEFLAVGTMAAFTIYLRQRGSPESKPVGAPHSETSTSG